MTTLTALSHVSTLSRSRTAWCRTLAMSALVAMALMWQATAAWALYKVIGPDGKVSYTDRPPEGKTAGQQIKSVGSGSSAVTANLPYELAQVAGRFPVTLYAFKACPSCNEGRAFLKQRGIPFIEKSVDTDADVVALERLTGGRNMPVLYVGKQRIMGYANSEWASYLDAAGYPVASALPNGYRWAAAVPLAGPAASNSVNAAASAASAQATAVKPRPSPSNKQAGSSGNSSGFRF